MRIFYFLFIILLSTTQYSFAQKQTLLKGMVTEIEVVSDSLNLAYSIYLPPNYTKATASKALFVLDPNGDGMRAARLFVSAIAGEEYVVVSNNLQYQRPSAPPREKICKAGRHTNSDKRLINRSSILWIQMHSRLLR